MKPPIQDRIVFRVLSVLTLLILLVSAVSLYLMYRNHLALGEKLIADQERIIRQQLAQEEAHLTELELRHIQEHALSIVDSIENALLYNLNKNVILEALKIFMKQESIRDLDIYDGITHSTYLALQKTPDGHIRRVQGDLNGTAHLKPLRFDLSVDDNKFGHVTIYYNTGIFKQRIHDEIERIRAKDYALLQEQTRELHRDIRHYLITSLLIFALFLVLVFVAVVLIFSRYIHYPLQTLRGNLQKFFAFFRNPSTDYHPAVLKGKDEFSLMSQEITTNIQTVLDLYHEVDEAQREILFTIGTIAEKHSLETANHVKRVAGYVEILGRYSGLSEEEIAILRAASPLHDIGKIAIPDAILNKPGKLTPEEFAIIQTHTEIGYSMLRHSKRPLLQAAAIIAYEHHEKYDGTGYPRGLKGEAIHLYGRIVAVADVFDALGNERVYKEAWSDEAIIAYFKEERGRHFDPRLIDILLEHYDAFVAIREEFKDTK